MANAADDRGHADLREAAVGAEGFRDLGDQLAGRGQHQRAAHGRAVRDGVGEHALDDGEREGGRLAGAGLGDAEQVAAFEQGRDGLGLDRGGDRVALLVERAQDGPGKAEILKSGQSGNLSNG